MKAQETWESMKRRKYKTELTDDNFEEHKEGVNSPLIPGKELLLSITFK